VNHAIRSIVGNTGNTGASCRPRSGDFFGVDVLTAPSEVGILQGGCRAQAVAKGGSDRVFSRVRDDRGATAILMRYSEERPENALFVPIARMLRAEGVAVPEIFHFSEAAHEVWMEDLGECDLHSLQYAAWVVRRAAYADALGQAARLHALAPQECLVRHPDVRLMPGFDERLYRWEREYFLENAAGRIFGVVAEGAPFAALEEEFAELTRRLLPGTRVLIHRDFQSQNVMWHRGRAWLIDFQGLRIGHPLYDVASLLYDPYVRFSAAEREELAGVYAVAAREAGVPGLVGECEMSGMRALLDLCGAQRLMQALGAYGFLALVRGKRQYLDFVRPALENLSQILHRVDFLRALRSLVDRLLAMAVK
jgi:aminoglycoside/choline kinase family phosphotransferase